LIIVIRRGALILFFGIVIIIIALAMRGGSKEAISFNHQNIKSVIIDPGHGEPDGGAVGKSGSIESELNLKIALKLRDELTERGYSVTMTREDSAGLDKKKKADMKKRLEIMKETPSDIFVSIHMNKFVQSKYRGAEVLYSDNFIQSSLLAELIMSEIREINPKEQTRSVKKAESSLYLMKNAVLPAVIVECGFLSNAEEEALLLDEKYQSRIASAICDGIISYYKYADDLNESEETEETS